MNIIKAIKIGAAALLASVTTAPAASAFSISFHCETGDIGYEMVVPALDPSSATLIVSAGEMTADMNHEVAMTLRPGTQTFDGISPKLGALVFTGTNENDTTLTVDGMTVPCSYDGSGIGDDGTREKSWAEQQHDEFMKDAPPTLNLRGRTVQDIKLRKGVGSHHRSVLGTYEGERLTILRNMGEQYRDGLSEKGYDWFEVRMDSGETGFVWGGAICANRNYVDGVNGKCERISRNQGNSWADYNARNNKWLAFATNESGDVGRGESYDQYEAERRALEDCDAEGCIVVDAGQDRCHAYYHSTNNGYWYGMARGQNEQDTRAQAKRYCADFSGDRGSCVRVVSTCQ